MTVAAATWRAGRKWTAAHTTTELANGKHRTGCGRVLTNPPPKADDRIPRCAICERTHNGDRHTNRPVILGRRQQ